MSPTDPLRVLQQLRQLTSENPTERADAVTFLGTLQDDPRVQHALRHLARTDPDPCVRQIAQDVTARIVPESLQRATAAANGPTWTCPACGTAQITTDTCPNCAAARSADYVQSAAPRPQSTFPSARTDPGKLRWRHTDVPFLFEPAHQNFLLGRSNRTEQVSYTLIFTLLLILLGIAVGVFVIFVVPSWRNATALERDGVITTGWVIDRDISSSDDSETYYVTYQFQVGHTDDYRTKEQAVSYNNYQRWTEDAAVEVKYLPDNPAVSEMVDDNQAATRRRTGWILSVIFIAGCVLGLLLTHASYARERRIVERGQILRGEVVAYESHEDSDMDLIVSLKYRFVTPGGKEIIRLKHATANQLKEMRSPHPGTPVAILYVNDRTHRLL